jgi:hypothetical protein
MAQTTEIMHVIITGNVTYVECKRDKVQYRTKCNWLNEPVMRVR